MSALEHAIEVAALAAALLFPGATGAARDETPSTRPETAPAAAVAPARLRCRIYFGCAPAKATEAIR
jgi:hypothetical protein